MLASNISGWATFRLRGIQFLALGEGARKVHIYDQDMNNYGAWLTMESFKLHAKKATRVEDLRL